MKKQIFKTFKNVVKIIERTSNKTTTKSTIDWFGNNKLGIRRFLICISIIEQYRRDAIQSAASVTSQLMDSVNIGVAHVFSNQKKLEDETRKLQSQTARFAKQTTQWLTMIENFNNSLKVHFFF